MADPIITVIEGPDGAGKSTIAWNLYSASPAGSTLIHNDVPPPDTTSLELYRFYMAQLKVAVRDRERGYSTIIDRSYLSEVIYGPIYRGGSLITGRNRRKLENFARRHNIHLLAVEAPLEVRRERIAARGEKYDFNAGIIGMKYEEYFETHKVWKTVSSLLTTRNN